MPAPRWKRQQWTVARAAAVLAAAVKPKGKGTPSLADIEQRFGLGLRELIFLARRLGAQEDLGVNAAETLGLDLDYRADGRLGLRSQGAESLAHLTRLSQDEARLAAQALRSLALPPADLGLAQGLASRLEAAAGTEQATGADGIFFRPTDPAPTRRKVALLAEAMELKRTVAFEYRGPASKSAGRVADPLSLRRDAGAWRLLAWDHQREALRVFALEHLAKLVITVGAFKVPAHLDLKALRGRDLSIYQPNGKEVPVKLRLKARLYQDHKHLFHGTAKPEKGGDWIQASLQSASPAWVVRTFLPFAPKVQILGPEAFEKEWARVLGIVRKMNR